MSPIEALKAALGALPAAMDEKDPVPLALGSDAALEAILTKRGVSEDEAHRIVRRALQHWCSRPAYLHATAHEQAWRHDLLGRKDERVSVEHQLNAAMRLVAMRAREVVR